MIDNFVKVVLLTSEMMWDSEVGKMNVEELHEVFKDYQRLENITVDNLLDNNEGVCFIEIQNNLFDYIITRLTLKEGQIKLTTRMQVFNDERKIVLCISYSIFNKIVIDYIAILKQKRDEYIRYLNANSGELLYATRLLPKAIKKKEDKEEVSVLKKIGTETVC